MYAEFNWENCWTLLSLAESITDFSWALSTNLLSFAELHCGLLSQSLTLLSQKLILAKYALLRPTLIFAEFN